MLLNELKLRTFIKCSAIPLQKKHLCSCMLLSDLSAGPYSFSMNQIWARSLAYGGKMSVVTEALLYSCCQEETAFILNYSMMAGHQTSRYVIQETLSLSVKLEATSWSIWKVKLSLCWIFRVLFLLTWHCGHKLQNAFLLCFSEYSIF